MKPLFVIFLFPLQLFAQDITGVWTGTLYNDTTKQYIKYELAISEYNGKLSGYSHTIFVIDSVENIGLKSVKVKPEGEDFIVTDEKLIYNNYPEPPAKGVKQFSRLFLSQKDSAMILSGSWETNRTREYSRLTGNIFLQKKKNIRESLILAKLDNLGLTHSLSFISSTPAIAQDFTIVYKVQLVSNKQNAAALDENGSNNFTSPKTEEKSFQQKINSEGTEKQIAVDQQNETAKNPAEQTNRKRVEQNPGGNTNTTQNLYPPKIDSTRSIKITASTQSEKNSIIVANQIAKSDNKAGQNSATLKKDEPKNTIPEKDLKTESQKNISAIVSNQQNSDSSKVQKGSKTAKPANDLAIANNQKAQLDNANRQNSYESKVSKQDAQENAVTKLSEQKIVLNNTIPELIQQKNESINPEIKVAAAAAELASRKIETIKTVEIKQDSLLLALYDNGEIDGDTVSVLLNGKVIMPRQGLMARAINKTIYLTPEMGDSITLIMYAENLGSIPPNTGLLVVHDGDDVYEIRFSGDLQKSSAIILKRRKHN